MKIGILTIFPDLVKGVKEYGVIAQAIEKGLLQIHIYNLRDYTTDKHKVVDDYPYGGGPGMVMKPEPFFKFFEEYSKTYGKPYVILTSPQGRTLNNDVAKQIVRQENIVIVCGRYEGIDERVMKFVDDDISIGDYVLTGGEIPAMVIVDVLSRFVPGVVEEESVKNDSFYNNLLDHPNYTRPREIDGLRVPDILVNGNHEEVELWRKKESLKRTMMKRPDLFLKHDFDITDKKALLLLFKELIGNAR